MAKECINWRVRIHSCMCVECRRVSVPPLPSPTMPQRCTGCQTGDLADSVKFCTNCGGRNLVAGGVAAVPASSASSSSSSYTAALPAAAALPVNSARIPMDAHEFRDFLDSLSRGLMRDRDQVTKIKAAASAHFFTCAQAISVAGSVKAHPGEAIITLHHAIVDADQNFATVLASLKWIEERQEVVDTLKLDASKYATLLKK